MNKAVETVQDLEKNYPSISWSDMPCLSYIALQPEFLRLSEIHQLEGAFAVFPGTVHTRLEHSMGVCHKAIKLFDAICKLDYQNHTEEGENDDDTVYAGEEIVRWFGEDNCIRECIAIAALCHDIGHGPFSHLSERFIKNHYDADFSHEKISEYMVRRLIGRYNETATRKIKESELEFILSCINTEKIAAEFESGLTGNEDHAKFAYLYQIVSDFVFGADVDRLDYFLRDSKHAGISTNIQEQKFFGSICIYEYDGWNILKHDDLNFMKVFWAARSLLFNAIYNDIKVLAVGVAIEDMLEKFLADKEDSFKLEKNSDNFLKFYCSLTDETLMKDPIFGVLSKSRKIAGEINNAWLSTPTSGLTIFEQCFASCYYPCNSYVLFFKPDKKCQDEFFKNIPALYKKNFRFLSRYISPGLDAEIIKNAYGTATYNQVLENSFYKIFAIFVGNLGDDRYLLSFSCDKAFARVMSGQRMLEDDTFSKEIMGKMMSGIGGEKPSECNII